MTELERLCDRVAELEELLGMHDVPLMKGVAPHAAKILGVLLRRDFVSWESMRIVLGTEMSTNYPSVCICKLRKWLGEDRDLIQTRWGVGAYIATKDKPRIRERIEQANQERTPIRRYTGKYAEKVLHGRP